MQEMPKAKNHTVMLDNRGKLVMTGTEKKREKPGNGASKSKLSKLFK